MDLLLFESTDKLFLFFSDHAADAEHRAEQDCRAGPDDPCALPFHRIKAPSEVNCRDDTPVYCGDGFIPFLGGLLIPAVIAFFQELLKRAEDHAGTDQEEHAC